MEKAVHNNIHLLLHTFFRNFKALKIVLQKEIFTFLGVNSTETLMFRFLDLWSKVSPHFISPVAVQRVVTLTLPNERLLDSLSIAQLIFTLPRSSPLSHKLAQG